MNYYMPYFNIYPNMISGIAPATQVSKGFFSRLLKGINFSSILNTTQKTLSVVNQALPVIKQVTPVMKNAKTIFKVMNEFKKTDIPTNVSQNESVISEIKSTDIVVPKTNNNANFDGLPTFFLN
ncbi:MAG: hypothetical protein E7165_00570 [Firmicutes bacterium]|nr:hypothetical protein [Bacillota bacterium]